MKISIELAVTLVVNLLAVGMFFGAINMRLKALETKVEKHNNFVERVYKVEASVNSAHQRIDDMKD